MTMLSMKKRFVLLSLPIMLLAILAAPFTSTASAASMRSASQSAGAGQHWTRVTAKNFREFFPKAHIFQTKIGPNTVICSTDSIQSYQNHDYVSTELGYTGGNYAMLRARAFSVGPWEKYTICDDNTNVYGWTIQSNANGLYTSTEIDYTGSNYAMLRARASVVGPWEKYEIVCDAPGYVLCYIRSNATAPEDLSVAEEQYYLGSGYGMLRARTPYDNVGTWEAFYIKPI